jgi:hypothetical protein
MDTITFKFNGTSPLMMHSDRGANPLDPQAKELKKLTSTRQKTDDIHEAVARMEWELGMYFDKELGPYLPTANLRATLVEGAKFNKLGQAMKRATLVLVEKAKLNYTGPRVITELWDAGIYRDVRSVVVGTSRVMRCRPIFPAPWSVTFDLMFDPTVIQRPDIITAATAAGNLVGLGDNRPNCGGSFGRFTVEAK